MTIVAGIDIGSLATKSVVYNAEKGILSYNILRSGYDYMNAAEQSIENSLKSAVIDRKDLSFIVSTGYGRAMATTSTLADAEVTEITCHAKGAHCLLQGIHTVIDIGGQDSKVIGLDDNGKITNFVMNDK